jgi:hypothetical protein
VVRAGDVRIVGTVALLTTGAEGVEAFQLVPERSCFNGPCATIEPTVGGVSRGVPLTGDSAMTRPVASSRPTGQGDLTYRRGDVAPVRSRTSARKRSRDHRRDRRGDSGDADAASVVSGEGVVATNPGPWCSIDRSSTRISTRSHPVYRAIAPRRAADAAVRRVDQLETTRAEVLDKPDLVVVRDRGVLEDLDENFLALSDARLDPVIAGDVPGEAVPRTGAPGSRCAGQLIVCPT